MTTDHPLVVGLGGSPGHPSVTNQLLLSCLARLDAETVSFGGDELGQLPIYGAAPVETGLQTSTVAESLVEAVRRADAVVIATPGYHGGMSGLVKNALDHLEALRTDARPYLDGRAVGVIVSAGGWQAAGSALVSVRSAVHALRGWPTPFGVTVNSAEQRPDGDGRFDERVEGALDVLAAQLAQFLAWQR
ncbi:NADPH-dependent FMN reductase [Jatrophihabitans endophyticus]|uniref:NADPH-dependent FMN reductase n=1 Tax=Jatrophihabitans endophyticus TaxID=1206085 RepID=UPI001A06FF48|nr:NADPH-dependent FMN reductase [Jatrophihabitans endophyticus]MBE7188508.1 NAD(P)H-dependent oxidoreductase [Jatrophihabitans endophyticus]